MAVRQEPRLPVWTLPVSLVGLGYLIIPLVAMGLKVPWPDLLAHLNTPGARDALALSLVTAGITLAIDVVIGIPLAVFLATEQPGVRLGRILVTLPLSLPPVVAGIALLSVFGRSGFLGPWLEMLGITVPFSTLAVVLAQVFVSLPFLVITVESALRARPEPIELVAQSLGARPTIALVTVALPQVGAACIRGAALALSRSLGEFGATLTFAGSLQGVTRTLPLQIYLAREEDHLTALSLGIVLVFVALLLLVLTEGGHALTTFPSRSPKLDEQSLQIDPSGLPHFLNPDQQPIPLHISGYIAARHWAVDLEVTPGVVTAVMGLNGSGKSTLAQVIAGALTLDEGYIDLGGHRVDGDRRVVPPWKRRVALVTQTPQLFLNRRVLDNVAAPSRWQGVNKHDARARAHELLASFGCEHLAFTQAAHLSGGQAACIALARALITNPQVLLLDEPTAHLDASTTAHIRQLIGAYCATTQVTTLLITHDAIEALQLAQHLVVLGDGQVVETGEPVALMKNPTSLHGARLLGLNVLVGQLEPEEQGFPVLRIGPSTVALGAEQANLRSPLKVGEPGAALFSPESVALYRQPASGSPRNTFQGRVETLSTQQGLVTVGISLEGGSSLNARVTALAWADLGLHLGDPIWVSIKATQIRIVPITTSR